VSWRSNLFWIVGDHPDGGFGVHRFDSYYNSKFYIPNSSEKFETENDALDFICDKMDETEEWASILVQVHREPMGFGTPDRLLKYLENREIKKEKVDEQ